MLFSLISWNSSTGCLDSIINFSNKHTCIFCSQSKDIQLAIFILVTQTAEGLVLHRLHFILCGYVFPFSYLEKFERINFFGEDAEDVLTVGRPHTPVGVGTFQAHTPSITKAGLLVLLLGVSW